MKEYTKPARQAIVLAYAESEFMRNAYLGTEHVLLGLISVRCAGTTLLLDAGTDLDQLQRDTLQQVGERTRPTVPSDGDVDMTSIGAALSRATPRLRIALERARAESKAMAQSHVGTEHLLLGLLHDSESVSAIALTAQGVDAEEVRARVRTLYGDDAQQDARE